MTTPPLSSPPVPAPSRIWSLRSIAILVSAWLLLQIGGLFRPGLLDDVDSIYIEIAREMLHRRDFITPYINGVRFFDKPPLMYWMASASMSIFGIKDWAARLPLALAVLALLLAVYALGNRLFAAISPAHAPDRGGFYAALALATSIGPYLYTRFFIPDILLALWMALAVHLFLIALDRIDRIKPHQPQIRVPGIPTLRRAISPSSLLPCLAFAAVMALNVLTKGLIGLVFPIAFVILYLAITRRLRLLFKLHLLASAAVFLAIAAPWHILAALLNPAIPLPTGLGLPATGGWAWFYLYNEHIARFLSKRIPHDYGLTPVWLFWLYLAIWIMPWTTFLPTAIASYLRTLRISNIRSSKKSRHSERSEEPLYFSQSAPHAPAEENLGSLATASSAAHPSSQPSRQHEAALALLLWAIIVLGFFTLSNRQEYYSLPAIPALALMAGGLLAQADTFTRSWRSTLNWHLFLLLPLTTFLSILCAYFALTAPQPAPNTDIVSLLAIAGGPEVYNLSLSHIFDLTGAAMGFFRGPLAATAFGMLGLGIVSYLLRRRRRTYAANLTLAASMICILLAAHEGLARFYPILGSKPLAEAINQTRQVSPRSNDLIVLDGELTSGSSLIFYTDQQIHLINGRVNGLWYGSFWPDAPRIFETESTFHQLWSGPRRIFLLTYNPKSRIEDLTPYAPVHTLATAGGKTILTNR